MTNDLQSRLDSLRLAHGWRLVDRPDVSREMIRNFLRPAVRAVPRSLAARFKSCRISLKPRLTDADLTSRWVQSQDGLDIEVASDGIEEHDLVLEVLLCLGQALWEIALPAERQAYLKLLAAEIEAGVVGEIDEEALREKHSILSSRESARSRTCLERYAQASFGGTVAEYIHCLWHDVTVRQVLSICPRPGCGVVWSCSPLVPAGSRPPLVSAPPGISDKGIR
jgi:hypothetical protein